MLVTGSGALGGINLTRVLKQSSLRDELLLVIRDKRGDSAADQRSSTHSHAGEEIRPIVLRHGGCGSVKFGETMRFGSSSSWLLK